MIVQKMEKRAPRSKWIYTIDPVAVEHEHAMRGDEMNRAY
jgi:hypothetical protein